MKDLLTEKTLMWVAIVALAISSYSLHSDSTSCQEGSRAQVNEAWKARMGQMQDRRGSRGDTGRGEWTGRKKGDKKKSKDSE